MKCDQLPFGLSPAGLAGFGEQVIHTTTHSKWGQLGKTEEEIGRPAKKNCGFFRTMREQEKCSFFDQTFESHADHGFQRMANTLSTEAPTEFGGNLTVAVEKRPRC
ncbi:hypothetical protein [Pseudomonas sp. NPDC089534]|uniref:hypothetical protein n=1 Tax=Pseudomonas sp. NPDC089534 TaxID=3364468 RepID=UPI003813E387